MTKTNSRPALDSGPANRLPESLEELVASPQSTLSAVGEAVADAVLERLDPQEQRWVEELEQLRKRIYESTQEVSISLPNRRGIDKTAPLGEIAQLRSKRPEWTHLLFLLTRRLRPARVLELGTCVGISAGYLAAGLHLNGSGQLVTLEGATALADLARRHLDELGLSERTEVVTGLFRDTLASTLERFHPIDLAFIDGHHDEQATQEYFEELLSVAARPAVVVFDDIAWSDGMVRAWQVLMEHPSVGQVVDLNRVGICVVGLDSGLNEWRGLDATLPTVSRMRARARKSAAR